MMTRPEALWDAQKNRLSLAAYGAVLAPIAAAAVLIAVLLLFPYGVWTVALRVLLTAIGLSLAYCGWQTRLLPFLRINRLYRQLPDAEPVVLSGVFRGEKDTQRIRDGVRMRVMRVDAGDCVKTEPVEREVCLPAVFSAEPKPDEPIRLSLIGDVVTAIEPDCPLSVQLKRGAYQPMRLIYLSAIVVSAALWLSVHAAVAANANPPKTHVAVCTVAYHAESEAVLCEAAKVSGVAFDFAYSTTLESEQLSQYLSTYGVFDADLILLPLSQFNGTLDSDTPPLSEATLPDGVRTVSDAGGVPIAVVLYDPDDPEASAHFSSVFDWIAIPANEPYLLCIGPSANETAIPALTLLLSVLSQNEFSKE